MGYYKLIDMNGDVFDVLDNPVWVKTNKRGMVVRCDAKNAQGVMSRDESSIYHIHGAQSIGEYVSVKVSDVSDDEYARLLTALSLDGKVSDLDNSIVWPEAPNVTEPVLDTSIDAVINKKVERLSNMCNKVICDGIDVIMSDSTIKHFRLEPEDQINLLDSLAEINDGADFVQYHSTGEQYSMYSAADIRIIVNAAREHRRLHTAYFGCLKAWVQSLTSIAEIGAIQYGSEIPDSFCTELYLSLRG